MNGRGYHFPPLIAKRLCQPLILSVPPTAALTKDLCAHAVITQMSQSIGVVFVTQGLDLQTRMSSIRALQQQSVLQGGD